MNPNPLAGDGDGNSGARSWLPEREDVELLLHISLFSQDDERALRSAWRILQGQTDDYLDVVLGLVAAYPPLVEALMDSVGGHGLEARAEITRQRFRRWLFETCNLTQDPPWLRQLQFRSPGRETSVDAAQALPQFRYLIALIYPVVAAARPFLVTSDRNAVDIEQMQYALLKAILLQVALLAKLYIEAGHW